MRMDGVPWRVLAGALLSYCSMIGLAFLVLGAHGDWGARMSASHSGLRILELRTMGAAVYSLNQWLWILAVFGIARYFLTNRDGPIRRYLRDAIFPFYIIHQTTIERKDRPLPGGQYCAVKARCWPDRSLPESRRSYIEVGYGSTH
jgi:hypothetical protein